MGFGEVLKGLRTHAGLTRAGLASISGLPIGTIRAYEQGKRAPLPADADRLAAALDVSLAELAPAGLPDDAAEPPARPRPGKIASGGKGKRPGQGTAKPAAQGKGERLIRQILEAAQAEGDPSGTFVRSAAVVRGALAAGGELTPEAEQWLVDEAEEPDPLADQLYDILVRLVCGIGWQPRLLDGQGNFGAVCYGHPDYPPAHPRYTECRITERGAQYLVDTA